MAKADMGKWAEKQVKDWLEARSAAELHFSYHRYPDARAARGALAAQPADYIVAFKRPLPAGQVGEMRRHVLHLEVKETAEKYRLPKKKIRQFGMLFRFWYAGIDPYLPVYRSLYGDWVLLGPETLFEHEDTPPSFDLRFMHSYSSADELLNDLFSIQQTT